MGEVAHALNASPDLDTVLRTAVEAVRGLVQADSSRIAIVDDAGRLVLRHSTQTPTAMAPGFVIERGMGIGGLAWDAGEPIRTDDIRADPRFRGDRYLPIAQADGIVSCMAVPVVTAGTVVGVIYANNFARRPFTAGDEALLVTLAHHAAVAVQKARLLAREHAARAEAEAASRGKDELLAMLGHELRNPLSAIANAVAVLGSPSPPPERRPPGARDHRAPERPPRPPGRRPPGRGARHLGQDRARRADPWSWRRRCGRASRRSPRAGAPSTTSSPSRSIPCGPTWTRRASSRSSATWWAMRSGSRRQGGTSRLRCAPRTGWPCCRVRDSGIGIAPEMLARVFDLFVQGERSADRGAGGLGLGLTLVRRIAELHGGSVEARSDGQGRGSEFTVRLPAMAPPPAAGGRVARPTADGAARRILVVEDNADAREMLRLVLELAGHEVHEAVDGPPGSRRPSVCGPTSRSSTSGCRASTGSRSRAGCARAAGAAIHLIALTGYGQPDDRRLALEAGFDAHLVKPVDPPALLAAIRAVFSAAREA